MTCRMRRQVNFVNKQAIMYAHLELRCVLYNLYMSNICTHCSEVVCCDKEQVESKMTALAILLVQERQCVCVRRDAMCTRTCMHRNAIHECVCVPSDLL